MRTLQLVDVHEASEITGLSPLTLYKLARQRRMRTFKVLGALRFDRADLLKLLVERPAVDRKR
jgi:excisionase family DNA binding protein